MELGDQLLWHGLSENFKKLLPVVALHIKSSCGSEQKAASFSFGQHPSKALNRPGKMSLGGDHTASRCINMETRR